MARAVGRSAVAVGSAATLALALLAAPAEATPAAGTRVAESGDFTEQAAQCLASSRVCALDGTDITAGEAAVAEALPDPVRLAVVAPSRLETDVQALSPNQLATQISAKAQSAVLVMVDQTTGKDRFGLAGGSLSTDQVNAFLTILNQAGANDGGEAIIQSAAELRDAVEEPAPESSSSTGRGPFRSFLSAVGQFILIAILVILILPVVIVVLVVNLRRARRRKPPPTSRVDKKLFDETEHADSVERSLLKLRELAGVYGSAPSKYTVKGVPIHGPLNAVIGDVQELFRRLRAHGSAQQARMAEVKYADVLRKLVLAVDRDYYKDIIDNPRLWSGVGDRVGAIGDALEAVHQQVLENIKQVNASKDLEFMVALDSLLESERAAKLSDVYGQGESDGPLAGDDNQSERQ
jgi:hypothetical protein